MSEPKALRPTEKRIELTLTIEGHYDPRDLEKDWTPNHAYGPVEEVNIHREMHSAVRNYDVIGVDARVIE